MITSNLVKVDILVNRVPVDAFSHDRAPLRGRGLRAADDARSSAS